MSKPIIKRRVLYVGPVGAGLAAVCATFPALAIQAVLARDPDLGLLFGIGLPLAFGGGVIAAFAFNMIAPLMGGMRIWIAEDEGRTGVRVQDEAVWTTCPACSERVRSDRTFCPACGRDFATEEE